MKKMTVAEARNTNGGAYKCMLKKKNWLGITRTCGVIKYTKCTMGYHFLLSHNTTSGLYAIV